MNGMDERDSMRQAASSGEGITAAKMVQTRAIVGGSASACFR